MNHIANDFDFKEQAKALLKRLGSNPGAPLNQGLAQAAVEAALREAYARGLEAAKGGRVSSRMELKRPAASWENQGKPSAAPGAAAAPECAHEWEETFIDGRSLGMKCVDCGILQRDVQERCEHYFVQVGSGEVCVACRKPRRLR